MKTLFITAFKQAGEPKELIDDFKQIIQTRSPLGGWKLPADHHVTTYFIGGAKAKLLNPLFEFFEDGKQVDVDVRAVVYIPGKIVAGVCFPKIEMENEFPHVTMMVSEGWSPVLSNAVLQSTCGKNGAFAEAYEAARENILPAAKAGVLTANITIKGKGSHEAVFVLLREPVKFKGVTKYYY